MTISAVKKALELAHTLTKKEQSKFADIISTQKPVSARDVEFLFDEFNKNK